MKESSPTVAIRCITFNHGPYIRQCLEGFVMQKTTFPFVAIVHDDASTDETSTIIKEYAIKYPHIIKPIFEKENQYSKRDGSLSKRINKAIEATGCKYMAICEGDDYWTDPMKLQIQFDFLESHPEFAFCCHRFKIYDQRKNLYLKEYASEYYNDSVGVVIDNAIFLKIWITQLLTTMFRFEKYRESVTQCYDNNLKFGTRDVNIFYYLLKSNKGFSLNRQMGVYRWHSGGIASIISLHEKRKSMYNVYKDLYYKNINDSLLQKKYLFCLQKYLQDYEFIKFKDRYILFIESINNSNTPTEILTSILSYAIPPIIFKWIYRYRENKRNIDNILHCL